MNGPPFRPEELDVLRAAYAAGVAEAPDDPGLPRAYGHALLAAGNVLESIVPLERVTDLEPRNAAAKHDLGLAFLRADRPEDAVRVFREAHEIEPEEPRMLLNLARAHIALGQLDQARVDVAVAGALEGLEAAAACLTGRIEEHAGDLSASEEAYRSALELDPTLTAAYAGLARIERLDETRTILRLLEAGEVTREEECSLRFALAQALDRSGDAEAAFAEAARANALHATGFDAHSFEEAMDELIGATPASAFTGRAKKRGAGLVFVVGLPRSGTSLVEQMLAQHPDVHALGEHRELGRIARERDRWYGGNARAFQALDSAEAKSLCDRYVASLPEAAIEAKCVIDKTPDNLQNLAMIARAMPGARIVRCVRDPRDACLSAWFHEFGFGALPQAYDLDDLAAHARASMRLAEHWQRVLPLRRVDVSYESLVQDPEPALRALLDFLGLAWEPACLAFHRSRRPVLTASATQVRRPLHGRSVGRWKAYEAWLGPLLDLEPSSPSAIVPIRDVPRSATLEVLDGGTTTP